MACGKRVRAFARLRLVVCVSWDLESCGGGCTIGRRSGKRVIFEHDQQQLPTSFSDTR
jgi:hypothetical protein